MLVSSIFSVPSLDDNGCCFKSVRFFWLTYLFNTIFFHHNPTDSSASVHKIFSEFITSLRSLQLKMFCALTSSTLSYSSHSDPLVSFNATVEIPWLLLSRISLLQSKACSSLQLRLSFFKIPASSTFLFSLTHSSLHYHFVENPKPWANHHWSSALLDLLKCHCYSPFSTKISPSSPPSPLNPENTDENKLPNQEMQAHKSIHEKVSEDDDPTAPPRPSISSLACWSLFLKTLQPQQDTCTPNKIATTWPTSWVCMGLGFSKHAYTVAIHMYSNVTNLELPVCSSHHHQERRRRRKWSCQSPRTHPKFPLFPFPKGLQSICTAAGAHW